MAPAEKSSRKRKTPAVSSSSSSPKRKSERVKVKEDVVLKTDPIDIELLTEEMAPAEKSSRKLKSDAGATSSPKRKSKRVETVVVKTDSIDTEVLPEENVPAGKSSRKSKSVDVSSPSSPTRKSKRVETKEIKTDSIDTELLTEEMAPAVKSTRKSKSSDVSSPSSPTRKSNRVKAVVVKTDPIDDTELFPEEMTQSKKRSQKTKTAGGGASSSKRKLKKVKSEEVVKADPTDTYLQDEYEDVFLEENEDSDGDEIKEDTDQPKRTDRSYKNSRAKATSDSRFDGEPYSLEEARLKWPDRYDENKKKEDEETLDVVFHYRKAVVDGITFNLNDDAYIQSEEGKADYIGRIVELFETTDKQNYITAQWFFRAEDTVIKDHSSLIDNKRVFLSDLKDDNSLDCILSKVKIVRIGQNIDLEAKKEMISSCDYYYDMSYSVPFCTFKNLPLEDAMDDHESSSTISSEASCDGERCATVASDKKWGTSTSKPSQMTMLDLYSGCGAMSTGLCLGAALSGTNLVTRWAVDLDEHACASLKFNHPETEVRNESAEDFLCLLKRWEKLCDEFSLLGTPHSQFDAPENSDEIDVDDGIEVPSGEFEVEKFVGICFGNPSGCKNPCLHFKVRWKNYDSSEDTWEPLEGLGKCEEKVKEFVMKGYQSNILPLPGDADVICGGPPCQGVSGYNRFRNKDKPLDDEKNHQLLVYMDIVEYLKPKYVLMENVVDIMRFAGGYLGRYALSRLVSMDYQARIGLMVAGSYGLPQFRMRVFLWGALRTQKLPQYPLPTHEVVSRGFGPTEFEACVVAYDDKQKSTLKKALHLKDAISDLPPVANNETRDEIEYVGVPSTEFQRQIRKSKHEVLGTASTGSRAMLFDHLPLKLNTDDYERVCRVPKEKGANFRNFPGVIVGSNNKVALDEDFEREMLPSGKPLVPDYALTFVRGTSTKPFRRLWWDEIVSTVVTRAEPHNQAILHPEQDRVLTIRENARLQGFPDYYKLSGPKKARYTQVGNAVAVPPARALGYALGLASQGTCSEEPLLTLPDGFPNILKRVPSSDLDVVEEAN